ncbi:MAG: hypothetical protein QXX13_08495 [Candidatus Methanomethylicia archaeon]
MSKQKQREKLIRPPTILIYKPLESQIKRIESKVHLKSNPTKTI